MFSNRLRDGTPANAASGYPESELTKLKELRAENELPVEFEELSTAYIQIHDGLRTQADMVANLHLSQCIACRDVTIWVGRGIVYPPSRQGPAPNADLPTDVSADYQEARSIFQLSPRGAAGLLRLAIQKLCKAVGESGENINADIAAMVKKGLSVRVQQALDYVRVIGNEAVHPGTIDLRDTPETAETLFGLVNLIAEKMISEPKHVEALYKSLPADKLAGIENRDKKK
jgi:hypothetical protein